MLNISELYIVVQILLIYGVSPIDKATSSYYFCGYPLTI